MPRMIRIVPMSRRLLTIEMPAPLVTDRSRQAVGCIRSRVVLSCPLLARAALIGERSMTAVRTRLAALAAAGALTTTALAATAASAWAVTVPHRGDSSLAVTRTFTQGGAGHGWMALIYRNVTRHACTVYGYPGLDAISSTGHVLAHATRTLSGYGSGGHLSTVTIRPGGFTSAGVEWLNFNPRTSGACAFSTTVNTIVANTSTVHRLRVSVSACNLQ